MVVQWQRPGSARPVAAASAPSCPAAHRSDEPRAALQPEGCSASRWCELRQRGRRASAVLGLSGAVLGLTARCSGSCGPFRSERASRDLTITLAAGASNRSSDRDVRGVISTSGSVREVHARDGHAAPKRHMLRRKVLAVRRAQRWSRSQPRHADAAWLVTNECALAFVRHTPSCGRGVDTDVAHHRAGNTILPQLSGSIGDHPRLTTQVEPLDSFAGTRRALRRLSQGAGVRGHRAMERPAFIRKAS